MDENKYQTNLSLQSPVLLDFNYKKHKVDKMLAILRHDGIVRECKAGLAVDVGCSIGFFSQALANYFDHVVGVDIDSNALSLARSRDLHNEVIFILSDSLKLPFKDNSVDLILCNHVYEHVPDAKALFNEIYRVLKKDGVCYLGAASRLTLVEPHYHLPLLSWFPKPVANLYMRVAGKGNFYYENLQTYWGIKKLIRKFKVTDYTLKVVEDPDLFQARDLFPKGSFLERIPLFIWKSFYWLLPSFIFLLKKQ